MVRGPCCEKMGMKKGPWTPEEDQTLISYIQTYGHDNWRALPKQAGLLRCGKSCRLRWTNYLRPDIKRGNFSEEEEETIVKLHQILGNRWSTIAARLPGRTDNEIKNFWHTHLKKKKRISKMDQNTTSPTNSGNFNSAQISPLRFSGQLSKSEPFVSNITEEKGSGSSHMSSMEAMNNENTFLNYVSEDHTDFWYNIFLKTGETINYSPIT